MTSSEDFLLKIYKKAEDYFKNKTKGFVVEYPVHGNFFYFRKIGSDLTFRLSMDGMEEILLDVLVTHCYMDSISTFSKSCVGILEYKLNGDCVDRNKVTLPHKRQNKELQMIIDHVQRSIRPNSISFIMDD